MNGIDTNVIVRLLTKDDLKQAKLALSLLKDTEAKDGVLFVSILVVLELLWVLQYVYKYERNEVINAIEEMMSVSVLKFEKASSIERMLYDGRRLKQDLSDLLIGYCAEENQCHTVYTFDRLASRHPLFQILI
jgi:predicted nucleic-acid-binding protein